NLGHTTLTLAISAACWSGWISRNEKVFKGKTTTLDSLIYQTKLRSFVWARVVYEECIFTKSDWWGLPRKSSLVKRVGNVRIMDWEPPPCGWLKFNVAGVSLDERAGCEGVLRDEKGVVSALFSGNCAVGGLEMVVLMAIIVAIEMFTKFDLNTVLNWLKYKSLRPWSLRKLFVKIEDGCRHIAEIQFAVTNHKKNGKAETLAKANMSRKNFFKAAW
ncbi:hypothetical protein V6Z11_D07G181200, partial [Gossypium hirsutum]